MSEEVKEEKSKEYFVSLTKKNELTPEQITELAQAVIDGKFGKGCVRSEGLGRWYNVVQTIVNTNWLACERVEYITKSAMVLGYIGEYGALQSVAEEAAELSKAALKYLRYMQNDNPVYLHGVRASIESARDAQELIDCIKEELSDVVLACEIAGFKPNDMMMLEKLDRSLTRLKEFHNGEDKEAESGQTCL